MFVSLDAQLLRSFQLAVMVVLPTACGQVDVSGVRDASIPVSDASSSVQSEADDHQQVSVASHPSADASVDAATSADAPNTCALPPASVDAGGSAGTCAGDLTDAGACLVTLATGQDRPSGIAVRGDTIVWANSPIGISLASIVRSSTSGGTPVTLASQLYASDEISLTLDDTNVYWAEDGVQAVPLSGGAVVTLYPGDGGDDVFPVRAGDEVYFVESQARFGLLAASTTGGGFTEFPIPLSFEPSAVAPSSTGIVYTWSSDLQGTPGGLASMPCGGPVVTLYTESSGTMGDVASAGDVVVFVKGTGAIGDLMAIPLEGGTARVLAAAIHADGIATDGVDVYWTDANALALMKLNLTSGQSQALAPYVGALPAGPFGQRALALDATSAYFTSSSGPIADGISIMKLTPR